ncbi:hypothetical protein TNCV_3398921 [Trichonephila clavipes]|nr:hypothetical protein TNCV_3398921 [Trichonephila clavipes]
MLPVHEREQQTKVLKKGIWPPLTAMVARHRLFIINTRFSAGRADFHRGGEQPRVHGHLRLRDVSQDPRRRPLRLHQQWLQRIRWSYCYTQVRIFLFRYLAFIDRVGLG